MNAYDYIIVGAGSAGCVLANRLSAARDVRVLLIEAGGPDRDPWIHIPLGWGKILKEHRHDWGYEFGPEPYADNRMVECFRGKVVGGCSSVNAMTYVRGHRGDFDRWAASGLTEWSYEKVLPFFKRSERWERGADEYRGGDGPLVVRETPNPDPVVDAYIAAARNAGYRTGGDYNGAESEGWFRTQQTIASGRRCSAAVAFLRPALARPNLELRTHTSVRRVVFEHGRAVGVELASGLVRAEREVIVACGAIASPQLLMLSGIGDADDLKKHGIASQVHLPAVGKNLQEHGSAFLEFRRKGTGKFHPQMRADRAALNVARAHLFGTGPATDIPGGLTAFVRTKPGLAVPDLQILARMAPTRLNMWFPGVKPAYVDGFGIRAALLHPESTGSIALASADPNAKPRFVANFLQTEADRRVMREGFRLVREISMARELDPYRGEEIEPGPTVQSDAELDAYIRRSVVTVYHPACTCRMGADEASVVDPELRVRGVEALRVVDASAMPDLVTGNINAAVIMIAEKAAASIGGAWPNSNEE